MEKLFSMKQDLTQLQDYHNDHVLHKMTCCEDCKLSLLNQTMICPKHHHPHRNLKKQDSKGSKATNDIDEESPEGDDVAATEEKKKKKRRKNKKKKKKKPLDQQQPATSAESGATPADGGEGTRREALGDEVDGQDDDGGTLSNVDQEFEEDLKQFSLRLQQQSSMLSSARTYGRFPKLRPNVSDEWLLTIKEICKSHSTPIPSPPNSLEASDEISN